MAIKAKKKAKKAVKSFIKKVKKTVKSIKSVKSVKSTKPASKKTKKATIAVPLKSRKKSTQKNVMNKKSSSKSTMKSSRSLLLKKSKEITKAIDLKNYLTPLDDRLVVEIVNEERVTPGGLYIPDTVTNVSGYCHGLVVAVGRGHKDKKGRIQQMDVQCGDKVLFSEYSGMKLDLLSKEVILLREGDVLGVVTK